MLLNIAVPLFALGFIRWREAVIGSLLLTIIEGALRKWLLPQFNQEIFFAKDFLLLGAYVRFFGGRLIRGEHLMEKRRANGPLGLLSFWAGLQMLNPLLPGFAVGVLGLIGYLFYAPLLYLAPAVVRDGAQMRRLSLVFLSFAAVALVLAPIQYFSAPDSILNIYSNQSDMGVPVIALAGDHARVTGTFSYLTGFTLLLSLVSLGTAAHLAIAGRARTRLLLCGALAVLITEILMTGSRAPVLILAAGFPAGFVLARYTRFPRHATHPILFLGLIVAAAVLATSAFPEVLQSFTQRATSSDDVWQRIFMPFVAGLNELAAPGPFGYGPGTTYQGAAILIPNGFVGPLPARAEAEWQRIVLELGPLGLIAVVLVRLSISYELWTALRQCEDLRLQPFLIAALLFTVIVVPGNLVFDHTASIYYWFIAGLALIRPAPLQRAELARLPVIRANLSGQSRLPLIGSPRVPISLVPPPNRRVP